MDTMLEGSFLIIPFGESNPKINVEPNPLRNSTNWVGSLVTYLNYWLYNANTLPQPYTDETSKLLWDDWEYIFTSNEEFIYNKAKLESDNIKKELTKIRENAKQFKIRSFFNTKAKEIFLKLNEEEIEDIKNNMLDSSKRAKIISDVVHQFESEWRDFIEQRFFNSVDSYILRDFRESFMEQPYSKNTVGAMKEFAWKASHGNGSVGLTDTILSEIVWSLFSTFILALRDNLNHTKEITDNDLQAMAEEIGKSTESIATLWLETVQKSKFGIAHEGILVAKWQKEELAKRKRLDHLKKMGAVDGKYIGGKVYVAPHEHASVELANVKQILESKFAAPASSIKQLV